MAHQAMNKLNKAFGKFKLGGNDSHPDEPDHAPHADEDDDAKVRSEKAEPGQFQKGARTPTYPQPGKGEPGPGQMPPKVAKLEYRERPMRFFKPNGERHPVLRDLGFTGVIDGKIIWTWGDTLMGTEKQNMICANDSTSLGSMKRPMTACDTSMEDGHVKQWIPANEEEKKQGGIARFGYGGTNIIEYAPNKGLVYYLKNDRKGGGQVLVGAGVAHVHMEGDIPVATREHDTLWTEKEPNYGDVGIAYDGRDKHVYVYGHGPNGDKEITSRTYLCRAPAEEAMDISKYEYWDNGERTWRKERMTLDGANGTTKLTQKHAIFDWYNMNQAAPFWSNYFNKWMFLHGDCFPFSDVQVRTADKLEGPWHSHGSVAKTDPKEGDPNPKAFRYCAVGHPEFDPSGKTVLATWTKANKIWGVLITWE